MRKRGFTLVELMVVVGIIVLLVAILIPGFSKIRMAGQNTLCGSNMRQLSVALMQYAQDNDSRIINQLTKTDGGIWSWPRFVSGRNLDNSGDDVIRTREYLAPGPVYACPIAIANVPRDYPALLFGRDRYLGYGMYMAAFEGTDGTGGNVGQMFPIEDHKQFKHNFCEYQCFLPNRYGGGVQIIRLTSVKAPSDLIWMADAVGVGYNPSQTDFYSLGSHYNNSSTNLGLSGINVPMGMFSAWREGGLFSSRISLYHGGKASVLFFDGHAAMLTAKEMNRTKTNARKFLTSTPQKKLDLTS